MARWVVWKRTNEPPGNFRSLIADLESGQRSAVSERQMAAARWRARQPQGSYSMEGRVVGGLGVGVKGEGLSRLKAHHEMHENWEID